MDNLKLTITMLPKGAWNNDLSKTLPKQDWEKLRDFALKRAGGRCEICGYKTNDLDVHEEWEFNIEKKTQTLKQVLAICSKCHGVKHFKNSVRLGYGEQAAEHFIKVNNCSEMDFASNLSKSILEYNQRNAIYRWKIVAALDKFGGSGIELKQNNIPFIKNPYESVEWNNLSFDDTKNLFEITRNKILIGSPKIVSINVDNYQGLIQIKALFADRIEWYLDGKKVKTKYSTAGLFSTEFKIKGILGKNLKFKIVGFGGETTSKNFELLPQEVL